MMAVNNAKCKYLFDNRYGTGQSVFDGINRTTNLIVAGKTVVVAGYGWCGKGVSMRAKGLGAKVVVTEVDAVKAMEAVMDGFTVMPMEQAAEVGDLFITVTGCRDVITERAMRRMKDGAILCNAGHFNVEINVGDLEKLAVKTYESRKNITGYRMADGRTLHLIAEGRLVNLAAGDGHPAEIMDMSFAIQALSARYLAKHRGELSPGVYDIPQEIDDEVARRKLAAWGRFGGYAFRRTKNISAQLECIRHYRNKTGSVFADPVFACFVLHLRNRAVNCRHKSSENEGTANENATEVISVRPHFCK